MNVLLKLLIVPFVAYFTMMITVAILGSVIGNQELKELTGGNGLTIWLGWIGIFFITTITHHFFRKDKAE